MFRNLIVLILLLSGSLAAQMLPTPSKADTPRALDPLLYQAARLAADGKNWREHVLLRGGHVDGARLLFEIAEFGQRTPVDGPWPNEESKIADRLTGLNETFATLQWIPSGSSTYQRGWIEPRELVAFHTEVLKVLPLAVTQRWVPPLTAAFGNVSSEGPPAMLANHFHALGTRGAGIRIAVLDLEFGGISSVAAAEVGTVETHPTQSLASLNSDGGAHGTACVEIIRDMAPDAQILVIREDVAMDTTTAVNYAITWGADIISRSVANAGYPETGDACQAAALAVTSGVYFLNAAGNFADSMYWESGNYTVGSGDYVRFSGLEELNQIATAPGTPISCWFSYEMPTVAYAGYRIELWENSAAGFNMVDFGNTSSTDQFFSYPAQAGATYFLAISRWWTGAPGRIRLIMPSNPIMYSSVYGSIANPATLPSVISVGAVSQTNYTITGQPEPYSSRGGGIFNLPLTVCAPTDCSTVSYGPQAYNGTSCACPNFAGFLALHLSRPEYAANPLGFMNLIDIPPAGWDPDTGAGLAITFVDAYESDNTPGQATSLGTASTTSSNHALAPANDVDWFTFSLTTPGDVVLETTGTTGDTAITLYDAALTQIGYDDDGGTGLFSLLTAPHLSAGAYFIMVDVPLQNGICAYSLVLTITRDSPTAVTLLTPADGATDEPRPALVSWMATTSLAPATYQGDVATDAAFANIVASNSGLTTTSATITGLQGGTTYYWRVRAQNPYGDSAWSSLRSFTTFAAPTDGGGGGKDDKDDSGCAVGGAGHAPWRLSFLAVVLLLAARRVWRRAGHCWPA